MKLIPYLDATFQKLIVNFVEIILENMADAY